MSPFDLSPILKFLTKLEKNNNKPWFDENRAEYQQCRETWIQVSQYLLEYTSEIEPDFLAQDPRKCIFRINRDIRFSHNKKPYKNNFGIYLVPGGKKSPNSGYYLHLEPGNSFIAGGIHSPDSERLNLIREKISKHGDTFLKILNNKKFKQCFGALNQEQRLKRPPRGFDKEHPYIELLKQKNFIIWEKVSDKEVLDKKFMDRVVDRFMVMDDFIKYLNQV